MTPYPEKQVLLRELKNYLIFLQDCGYTEIPWDTPSDQNQLDIKPLTYQQSSSEANMKKASSSKENAPRLLQQVREELGDCTRCKLSEGRNKIVFGSGNPKADQVFVGEGPGKDEDEQGFPFVGRAGKKLTEIIE